MISACICRNTFRRGKGVKDIFNSVLCQQNDPNQCCSQNDAPPCSFFASFVPDRQNQGSNKYQTYNILNNRIPHLICLTSQSPYRPFASIPNASVDLIFVITQAILCTTPPGHKKIGASDHACSDFGGERGIRTLETLLTPTRFPIVRLRPAQPSLHGRDNAAYYNHFLSIRQEVKCKSLKKFDVVAIPPQLCYNSSILTL